MTLPECQQEPAKPRKRRFETNLLPNTMPTPEQALQFVCDAVLYQHIDLTGPWQGWKIRGQFLVSPDRDRIMVRELVGVLIHYRAKFGHRTRKQNVVQALPDNVVPFAQAAQERLTVKLRAERSGQVKRVGGAE